MQPVSKHTMCACHELVVDENIYPRCRMSEAYIAELAEALQSGATLPPILVDKQTKKILDGGHRYHAYQRVYGKDAFIPVEWAECRDEKEMLRLAIQSNAKHGMRLERVDQRRCVHLLSQQQYSDDDIANLLALPVKRVELLRTQVAIAPRLAPQVIPGTAYVPLKRSVVHLSGRNLSAQQMDGIRSAPGTSYRLLIYQLTDGIEKSLLPMTPPVLEALAKLVLEAVKLLQTHKDQLSEEVQDHLETLFWPV